MFENFILLNRVFFVSILIRKIANKKSVILLQNAFPTLEKYIDYPHITNGKPLKVIDTLRDEITSNFITYYL